MPYITPDTNVRILRDVYLDTSQVNTIYFSSPTTQYNYFSSKTKYNLSNQSYQRTGNGVIRVNLLADNLYDCTYMMFQNNAYGNKWFYAFITEVEYVNNVTANIYYELDDVQTWLAEMTLMPCMIERTHIPTIEDTIGANINPEPFALMEYVYDLGGTTANALVRLYDCNLVIQICDAGDSATFGDEYDRNFSGASLFIFEFGTSSDIPPIINFLTQYVQRPDAVLGMYLVPKTMCPTYDPNTHKPGTGATGKNYSGVLAWKLNGTEDFGDNFVPKNKKLYTYPYNLCQVLTPDGQKMSLRFEFCNNLEARVNVEGTFTTPVQVIVRPTNYKGYGVVDLSLNKSCYDECLTISNFPLCSWVNDYYSSWVSQNALPLAVGTALTVGGLLAGGMNPSYTYELTDAGKVVQSKIQHFMSLDPEKQKHAKWFKEGQPTDGTTASDMAVSALPNAINALQQMYVASIHADTFRGNANNNNVDIAHGNTAVYSHRAHIPSQQARMIDDYFEKYGYAIGKIQTPVRNQRAHWTYIKTQGCVIHGRCPASVIAKVESLYNRGITWWNNGDEIGDYTLNNH